MALLYGRGARNSQKRRVVARAVEAAQQTPAKLSARFLMQSTFGPTLAEVTSLAGSAETGDGVSVNIGLGRNRSSTLYQIH